MREVLVEFEETIRLMSRAELGGLLKEYIAESNHNSWEGFSSRDLTGIRKFLKDLMLYYSQSGESFATKITTTNPVP